MARDNDSNKNQIKLDFIYWRYGFTISFVKRHLFAAADPCSVSVPTVKPMFMRRTLRRLLVTDGSSSSGLFEYHGGSHPYTKHRYSVKHHYSPNTAAAIDTDRYDDGTRSYCRRGRRTDSSQSAVARTGVTVKPMVKVRGDGGGRSHFGYTFALSLDDLRGCSQSGRTL